MSQLAGGFTISKTTPVYLEGGIAYSRYDPTFILSNGRGSAARPGEVGQRRAHRRRRLGLPGRPGPVVPADLQLLAPAG
jgi:hypothetical protein